MTPFNSLESLTLALLASVGFIVTVFGMVGCISLLGLKVQEAWLRRVKK